MFHICTDYTFKIQVHFLQSPKTTHMSTYCWVDIICLIISKMSMKYLPKFMNLTKRNETIQ